jgi:AcrR family transcriptional regulator
MSAADICYTSDVSNCNQVALPFVSRWEPNAQERLVRAAMDLYAERGFGETTAAEIAARAGLTERTFFRYFADKREVLFSGSEAFVKLLADGVAAAPPSAAPLEAVVAALQAMAAGFEARRDFARQRHALICAHAELRERELIKLASVSSAMAEALRSRGVKEPSASLAAKAGIAVLEIAFDGWAEDTKKKKTLSQHVRESLGALEAVAGDRAVARRRRPRPAAR